MALPIQTPKQPRLYTVAEFLEMPEYNERFELIHGRLVEKPIPKYEHGWISRFFIEFYFLFDPTKKLGEFISEVSFKLAEDYAPTPDVSYYIASRRPARKAKIAAPPDIAVEVQSPGQSLISLTNKAQDYLEVGVKLVWIIQPGKEVVKVLLQGGKIETFGKDNTLDAGGIIPGFSLKVSQLFED